MMGTLDLSCLPGRVGLNIIVEGGPVLTVPQDPRTSASAARPSAHAVLTPSTRRVRKAGREEGSEGRRGRPAYGPSAPVGTSGQAMCPW